MLPQPGGVSDDLRRTRLSGEPESFGSWLCRGWRLPWCGGAAIDSSRMLRILASRLQVTHLTPLARSVPVRVEVTIYSKMFWKMQPEVV